LASDDRPDPCGVVVLTADPLEHAYRVADRAQGISKLVGEHREELVLATIAFLDLAVEASVVAGDGRAAPEVANEIDVGRGVAAAGIEHGEGERAERGAACRQRRHDGPYLASVRRGQRLQLVALDHAQTRGEQLAG